MEEKEILAYLVRLEDGFHMEDLDGNVGPVCTGRTSDGYIKLTENAANRKCYNEKNANKFFDEHPGEKIGFVYKETRTVNVHSTVPNAKLISYLPEDLQKEYFDIIERAKAARDEAKAKPLTDLEKAQKALAKAEAKLKALLAAEAGENDIEEDM